VSRSLWTCAALLASAPTFAANLLIEHVTVVSPQLSAPLPNRQVLVTNGRIATISEKPIDAPADTPRLDGRGKFLTPGLMDAHVHVSEVPGLPPAIVYGPDQPQNPLSTLRDAYVRQQPRSYLYFGVTQLLDPANVPQAIARFKAQPLKPDLYRCGATTALDGYPSLFADKPLRYALMPDYIYEPANAKEHPLPEGAKAEEHTPEAVVARIAASGALCVKLFIENGFGDDTSWPILSEALMKRVRAAADQHHLLLMTHANALDMQTLAINLPTNVLAHGLWGWGQYENQPGLPDALKAHLDKVHAKQIGYVPTLRVLAGMADLFDAKTLDDPNYSKVVPGGLLAWYRTPDGQWYKAVLKEQFGNMPDERTAQVMWRVEDQGARAMVYLHSLGHPLLLGSDTPSAPTYGNQPGYDTFREMQLMAKAGITPRDIFAAATINNAKQFRLDKDYGTIERGKVANLLLLDADPLKSVEAWNRIDKVVLHGQPIARESLAAPRN
jgi:imidazolonepropionase-like amidohydrolase